MSPETGKQSSECIMTKKLDKYQVVKGNEWRINV